MKYRLKSSLFAGLMCLLTFLPGLKKQELKEITKPHLGVYECTEIQWKEEDLLNRFSRLSLELKTDEEFVLHYCEKGAKSKTERGKYVYDRENGTITLIGGVGGLFKRDFPLSNSILTVSVPVGGDILILKFKQK